MRAKELILAGLATKIDQKWASYQIQKMLFLFEDKLKDELGELSFNFTPGAYGPVDKTIYDLLDQLVADQKLFLLKENRRNYYVLSVRGYQEGQELLTQLLPRVQSYFQEVTDFLTKNSFSAVIAAIYKEYPVFRENGVFSSQILRN